MCVCVYIYTHTHTHTLSVNVCLNYTNCVCVYVCIHVRMSACVHIHTHTEYECLFILYTRVCVYEGESKSNAFFFSTDIITNTRMYIIHQNEAGPLRITSLLLNRVTVSLNHNVPPSNLSLYPCFIKFCRLFFEPLHHCSFHFLITGIILVT